MTATTFPPGSRLVAYLRDSGGRDQNLSTLQQQAAIGDWCKENDLILSRTFVDEARTGTTTAGRDAFLEMIAYLDGDTPEIAVVFWEYSRLSREYDDLLFFISDLRRRGYAIHSLTDNIPPGLDGRLMEAITAWKNAKYSEDLRRNVKRGLRYVAVTQKAFFGHPPIGYKLVAAVIGKRRDGSDHTIHRLEPDEKTAPLVRRAFALRAAGSTYREIHAETNLFTWLVTYGKLLHNPIYIGRCLLGDIDIDDFCQPLIDQATWTTVQAVNTARAGKHGYNHPRSVRSRYFLTGLLLCARCGMPMHGHAVYRVLPYQGINDYYRCQSFNSSAYCSARYIPKAELETRVLTAIKEKILQSSVLEDLYLELIARRRQDSSQYRRRIQRLQDDLAAARNQVRRIVRAIKEAGHSTALLRELAECEKEEADLAQRLAQLESSPPQPVDIDLDELIDDTRQAIASANERQMGVILRGFILEVRAERIDKAITGNIKYTLPGLGGESVVSL